MDKQIISDAITGAISTRGPRKGRLKAKCPPVNTPAAAAWQAIMSHANPHKMGLCHMLFMDKDNKKILDFIDNTITEKKIDVRAMDIDRFKLECLGVW